MIEIDDKTFKEAVIDISHTDAGKVFFSYLKDELGWENIILSTQDNDVNIFYGARRGVYGSLRKLIPNEELKKIEFNYKRKAVTNERSGTTKRNTRTD